MTIAHWSSPSRVRHLYQLTVGISIGAIVADASTSWWMQQHGAIEVNPVLIAVKAVAGLFGMVFVLVVVKALALAVVEALWVAARSFGRPSAEWATATTSTLVCVVALLPVLHNLRAA